METSDNEENARRNGDEIAAENNNGTTDEYNFDAYDDEGMRNSETRKKNDTKLLFIYRILDETQVAAIGDIAAIDPNEHFSDHEDSETEDDIIKPTDNLVLVGHVDDDAASLEVYGNRCRRSQKKKLFANRVLVLF